MEITCHSLYCVLFQANSDASDTDNQTHGLNTVKSSDSVQEYFAKKMAERMAKLKGKDVESLDVYTESADREDLNLISNDCDNVESLDASENIDLDKKKKKRSKKDKTKKDTAEVLDKSEELLGKNEESNVNRDKLMDKSEELIDDSDCYKKSEKRRSKKDKTKKDMAEVNDKSEELLGKNEESNVNRDKLMDKSEELIDDSDCHEKSEKTKKKSRKSKKCKTDKSTENMVEGDLEREEADEFNIEAQSKSKKKKDQSDSKVSGKKRKRSTDDVEAFNEKQGEADEVNIETRSKSKKERDQSNSKVSGKKRKRSTDDVEALNEEQGEADEGNREAQSMDKKKKKSKKTKNDVSEKLGERTELNLKDSTDLIDKENKMKYLQEDSEKSVTKEDACSSQASSFVTDFSQSDDKASGRKRRKSVKFYIEEEGETLREEVEIHENQSVNKKNKKSEKKRKEIEENVARDNKPQGQETVVYGGDPQASKMKRLSVFPKKSSTKKQKIETIEEGKKSGNQVKVGVVAQHKTKRNRKPKSRKKKEIVRESRTNSGQKDLSESKLGGVLNSKKVRKKSGQKDLSKSKLGGVRNSKEVRKNSGQKDFSESKLGGVPNSKDIKKNSGKKDLSEIKLDDLWYSRQEIKLGGVPNSSDVKKNDSGPIGLLINNFGVDQDTLDSGSAFRGSNLSKVKGYIGLNKATIMTGLERKRQKMGFRNRAFNHPIPNAKKMGFRDRAFDHPIPNAKKHVKFPI